jgi:hypothetical protein
MKLRPIPLLAEADDGGLQGLDGIAIVAIYGGG